MDYHGLRVTVEVKERYQKIQKYYPLQKKEVLTRSTDLRMKILVEERYRNLKYDPSRDVEIVQARSKRYVKEQDHAQQTESSQDLELVLRVLEYEPGTNLTYDQLRHIASSRAIRRPIHRTMMFPEDCKGCMTCGLSLGTMYVIQNDMKMCSWCLNFQRTEEEEDLPELLLKKKITSKFKEGWIAPWFLNSSGSLKLKAGKFSM